MPIACGFHLQPEKSPTSEVESLYRRLVEGLDGVRYCNLDNQVSHEPHRSNSGSYSDVYRGEYSDVCTLHGFSDRLAQCFLVATRMC